LYKCQGTHKSIFCKNKEGIAYEIFNNEYSKEKCSEFTNKIFEILEGWLPHTTNYLELKKQGWHTSYDDNNQYVDEYSDYEGDSLYHDAWSKLPKDKLALLFAYFDECTWLPENKFEIFKDITGLEKKSCCTEEGNYCSHCGSKLR